jgi:transposase
MKKSNKITFHSLEKKIDLVNRYESGENLKLLAVEQNLNLTQLKYWVQQYKKNGIDGFKLSNRGYSLELKWEIVLKILNGDLSSYRASIDYRITKSVLEKWVKKAREFGMDALAIDGRGRTRKNPMYQSKKKSSKPLTREEELLQENEFLRAENAFLKKLKALVEERVARENGSTRKSSNN